MEHQKVTRTTQAQQQRTGHALTESEPSARAVTHPVLQLQRMIGNQGVQRLIQAKLEVDQPSDKSEQEADWMAKQVLSVGATKVALPLQRKCGCDQHTIAGGECEECRQKREGNVQRAAVSPAPANSVAPIVYDVLNSPAQPLDAETKAFMESRFGHVFSQVRVHTDDRAAESVQAVNAPNTHVGQKLIAHELTHTIQQQNSQLAVVDSLEHEREADTAADAVHSHRLIPTLKPMRSGLVSRQKLQPDESPKIGRSFELDPQLFLKPMDAPAVTEGEKCEEFPGGSTDCEMDEKTGTPTGKVTHRIDETNRCTRPCVEQHEAVHVKQFKTFCPKLRDCYLSAAKGKRPAIECAKMAIFGAKERECPAYKVSVPCMENRLKNAKECQSKENKAYGTRKLASEKCFRNKNCGGSGGK